ncbi:hypothetical protein HMI48_00600 [Acidithiobacillus ferrooxidans]|uniref:hypothetical protein n=1 Tax=Acidithiobacillus ferrooxidans TaxID=920 RepID=UPI001C07D830|nr:hypothetical protein [Acidithiobacillus ferrooxidans]MBU2772461.1 hypothetical protein [Acidithiobacillus ferrooxidans]
MNSASLILRARAYVRSVPGYAKRGDLRRLERLANRLEKILAEQRRLSRCSGLTRAQS